jgi:hypothetical protein
MRGTGSLAGPGNRLSVPIADTVVVSPAGITRHLAHFKAQPTEELAHSSAAAIMEFVKKPDCSLLQLFSSSGSQQLRRLDQLFRTAQRKSLPETAPLKLL